MAKEITTEAAELPVVELNEVAEKIGRVPQWVRSLIREGRLNVTYRKKGFRMGQVVVDDEKYAEVIAYCKDLDKQKAEREEKLSLKSKK